MNSFTLGIGIIKRTFNIIERQDVNISQCENARALKDPHKSDANFRNVSFPPTMYRIINVNVVDCSRGVYIEMTMFSVVDISNALLETQTFGLKIVIEEGIDMFRDTTICGNNEQRVQAPVRVDFSASWPSLSCTKVSTPYSWKNYYGQRMRKSYILLVILFSCI